MKQTENQIEVQAAILKKSFELHYNGRSIRCYILLEGFVEKLESYYPEVKYVNRLTTHSWGQKVIRFYDPDGNLIEVGTPM